MRIRWCLGFALLAAMPTCLVAQTKSSDWPEWRGPLRDGISKETGLLQSWPEKGPKLLWSAADVNGKVNVGRGYASMVIADGKIFTLGDRDGKGHVICLEEATGKILWKTPFTEPYNDGGPRCTPTVAGNRIYGLSAHGDLVCCDTKSGEVVWQKNLKKDFAGRMMSGWNYSESPLVDGDRLICTPGGKDAVLVALDKETGSVIWNTKAPQASGAGYASPIVSKGGGVKQYLTLLGPELGLVSVDAETGKFLWNYKKVANGTANIPTPIVAGDYVFASTAYGTGSVLLHLKKADDGVKAEEVYFLKANQLQNHHGGMVMLGDYIYGGHNHNAGLPFCLEWKTGKMAWGPVQPPGSGSAAVLYADGQLYFRYDDNTMALIEATPKEYKLNGSFQLPKGTSRPGWQHPVIHNKKLFIRANDQLYCFDIAKH
jgi:outer membrane protein assembly factor BamB